MFYFRCICVKLSKNLDSSCVSCTHTHTHTTGVLPLRAPLLSILMQDLGFTAWSGQVVSGVALIWLVSLLKRICFSYGAHSHDLEWGELFSIPPEFSFFETSAASGLTWPEMVAPVSVTTEPLTGSLFKLYFNYRIPNTGGENEKIKSPSLISCWLLNEMATLILMCWVK